MKLSRFLMTTALVLSSCTTVPKQDHIIHLQNVHNFARHIDSSENFSVLTEWNALLKRSPVYAGQGTPTLDALRRTNETINHLPGKAYDNTGWQTPLEFVASPVADCKGYAVAKYYALRALGFSADQLNLWSGDYKGKSHLILVAEVEGKEYVLDIMEPELPEASTYFYKNFQPGYRLNEQGWDFE